MRRRLARMAICEFMIVIWIRILVVHAEKIGMAIFEFMIAI
jgi:hypothetical protein